MGNFKYSNHLTCMSLYCGRTPGCPKKTRTDMGRTEKVLLRKDQDPEPACEVAMSTTESHCTAEQLQSFCTDVEDQPVALPHSNAEVSITF